ncbi:ABC transporter substrate-binding protein [Streptomyces abyssomicinicus]|uniref:ABC transporter substrate-binding protein n=1 Tax=Streptomyces abyssomicinicus TaxID=574929 RepID=UPI001C3FC182|nr:ABC transporter substrate-binding protein [Streptomyces abyssomicinicus]
MNHPSTRRLRAVAAAALLTVTALLATACGAQNGDDGTAGRSGTRSGASLVTVTDSAERTVEFPDGPVGKVALVGGFNVDLALALGARDQIVGIDDKTIAQENFADFPSSLSIGASSDALNYERIIQSGAEAVVMYGNQPWQAAESSLKSSGVQVLVVSSWVAQDWKTNVELLGKVLGRDKEAAKVLAFTDKVEALTARAGKEQTRATAYYEDKAGRTSGEEGGKTLAFGQANVRSIFADSPGNTIDSEPAAVLAADPDVIVVETDNVYGGRSEAEYEEIADKLLARPGWKKLKAVRNGKLFLFNPWAFDLAGNQISPLFFATFAYPDRYQDVDPLSVVEEWSKDYIGATEFTPQGYVYQVEAQ